MGSGREIVPIEDLLLVAQTDKAFLVRKKDIDPAKAKTNVNQVWIPLSQIESTDLEEDGDVGYIEIPEWLADDKGLD